MPDGARAHTVRLDRAGLQRPPRRLHVGRQIESMEVESCTDPGAGAMSSPRCLRRSRLR